MLMISKKGSLSEPRPQTAQTEGNQSRLGRVSESKLTAPASAPNMGLFHVIYLAMHIL